MHHPRPLVAAFLLLALAGIVHAEDETTYSDNASALMGQKKYAEAEVQYRKSIAVDPRYKEAWQGLAACLTAEGKTAQAALISKIADAAPAARSGPAPALSAEQQAALADTAPPAAPEDSAQKIADLQRQIAELKKQQAAANTPPAPAPTPAPAPQPAPEVAAIPAPPAPPLVPLAQSPIVAQTPAGPAVQQKSGKPIDGLKLSQHDMDISSPNLAVAPDGTLHAVFVEEHKTTYAYAVYHRSSTDGGKTWSDAKNLSELMPGIHVGMTRAVCDNTGRLFVVWRAGLGENFPAAAHNGGVGFANNLVYRVLANGKWSKILFVHPPASATTQDNGSQSWFLAADPAGKIHVIFNTNLDERHPESLAPGATATYHQHLAQVGTGLILESILDGSTPTPHELLMAKLSEDPNGGGYSKWCDGYDDLEGYVDAAGHAHILAYVYHPHETEHNTIEDIFENGKETNVLTLPGPAFQLWSNPGKLLVDARGRQHVIVQYDAGERPAFKDYLVGSDDEPTIIRAAAPIKGKLLSFEAYQLPGGRMAVLMQLSDTGDIGQWDNYIATSDGTAWSPAVNITNNAGRAAFASHQDNVNGAIVVTRYSAGPGAVALDRSGHLLVLMVNSQTGSFAVSTVGIVTAGGSTSTPMLFFLKF